MIVFSPVTMLYIPRIATIAALAREFGWERALFITVFEIIFAIVVGGVALRLLMLAKIWRKSEKENNAGDMVGGLGVVALFGLFSLIDPP